MEFSPSNNVVKLCIQGMAMEDQGKPDEASKIFLQAWDEATDDFEKFIAAYYVARHQDHVPDKLKWLQTALQFALDINDESVKAAFPSLYSNIAKCYEEQNDHENAERNRELAASFTDNPSDNGPFYHGTRADLQVGDMLFFGLSRRHYVCDFDGDRFEIIRDHRAVTSPPNRFGTHDSGAFFRCQI